MLRRIGAGTNDSESTGDERTTPRGAARSDQQPLLEARRVGENDVKISGSSGSQNLPRRADDDVERDAWFEGIEQCQGA